MHRKEEMEISLNVVDERNQGSNSTANHSWVVKVEDKFNNMKDMPEEEPLMNERKAIYKRPVDVQEKEDTFLYTPCLVSFGPYHHDHKSCQKTNEIKEDVLLHWLKRSDKELHVYADAVRGDVEYLKNAYAQLDPQWRRDDNAFLQLMIYDACFFLEILHEAKQLDENHIGHLFRQVLAIYRISPNELMECYRHDMLLIENQLPMQLLVKLVAAQDELSIDEAQKYLYELILKFVAPSFPSNAEKLLKWDKGPMYLHVLDLYRHGLLYEEGKSIDLSRLLQLLKTSWHARVIFIMVLPILTVYLGICITVTLPISIIITIIIVIIAVPLRYCFVTSPDTDIYFIIPSATELHKVGFGFERNKTNGLKDISFSRGTLWLPRIYIDGTIQSRFLNIIAFEQLHADAKNEVTSYIYFMSRILQSADDVRLLQLHGIICTMVHNDHVVELFKSATKDIVYDPNIFFVKNYCDVGRKLTESFCVKMNNGWQRDLWQTYLKSPWAVISVVAAFFLFTLASVQTVYTVLSYYKGD